MNGISVMRPLRSSCCGGSSRNSRGVLRAFYEQRVEDGVVDSDEEESEDASSELGVRATSVFQRPRHTVTLRANPGPITAAQLGAIIVTT